MPADNSRLANLCGQFDEHLRQIERRLDVEIASRGNRFRVTGNPGAAKIGSDVLRSLFNMTDHERLDPERVHVCLQESVMNDNDIDEVNENPGVVDESEVIIQTRRKLVRPRGPNQRAYLGNILEHDLAFGIGPAGTGKTYLAVAAAVDSLYKKRVKRIVLARPAVEAGENLGFLPGDLQEKVDPYLRPLYDALEDMMPHDRVSRAIEDSTIEIAPLAYMRGRTLSDAFVILDEAQNATRAQMKMFLTRLGLNSRVVITGDKTQIDLPNKSDSGLLEVEDILGSVEGIKVIYLDGKDVIRHRLVKDIIKAYAKVGGGEEQ